MALVLDPTLKSAQDGISHHPIMEIISSKFTSDIPYLGQYLTSDLTASTKPNAISHSSGRLCLIYNYGASKFKYVYTDTEKTSFYFTEINLTPNGSVEATLCELVDGNIGIIYISDLGTTRQLRYMIIDPTGEVVHVDTLIATYTESEKIIDMPFVIRLQNGTYLLVYYHQTVAGPSYVFMRRTSSDFVAWSSESECVLDLGTTKPYYNPYLLQVSNGDIFLWFDYRDAMIGESELTNIYYSISIDNGGTFGSTVKKTNYTNQTASGKHPTAIQKVENQMHMAYYELRNALHFTKGSTHIAVEMTFSPEQRKLYVVWITTANNGFWGVSEIDIDTWTETRFWDCSTDPPFPYPFCLAGTITKRNNRDHGEYPFIPVSVHYSSGSTLESVALLNVSANTIIAYHFITCGTYGITKNILDFTNEGTNENLAFSWVDATSSRLYVVFSNGYMEGPYLRHKIRVGYLEIGDYHWHQVFAETGIQNGGSFTYNEGGDLIIDLDIDRVFLSIAWVGAVAPGQVRVYSISEGALVNEYKQSTDPNFPYRGLVHLAYLNNRLYGTIREDYETNPLLRGLTEIDLTTNIIVHHKPTWGEYDNYKLNNMKVISDSEIAILSGAVGAAGYGITIFDITTHDWLLINNINTPGLTPDGSNSFQHAIAYDPVNEIILAGSVYWVGIVAVSKYGAFRSTFFEIGVKNGSWVFGESQSLLAQWKDYELVMAFRSGDLNFYMFWTKQDEDKYRIKWEKEEGSFDVTPYIVNIKDVALSRSIGGNPAGLTFTVSHGYLFDPQNLSSLWSIYLQKFRKLNLKFGEKVGVTNYWQQQGVFIIRETSISYERKEYPVLNIIAEDKISTWENNNVTATPYYEATPKEILEDVMVKWGGMALNECNFPDFVGSFLLYYQWVEKSVKDILDQICERFCYFPMIEVDGKVSARLISKDDPIDHEYSGATWLVNFTPDDSFSDFTNRIIVVGEGRELISVLYNEERVGNLVKTVGWWGGEKDNDVWYSTDGSRQCRYPRLEIVESVKNFNFKLGGGDEYISKEDSDYRYCTITIECPDMVAWVVGALVVWLALKIAASILDAVPFVVNVIEVAAAVLLVLIIGVVCSQANCSYVVWAQPIGYVRWSFQAQANDLELQNILEVIITKTYQDPLCYSIGQCQTVANQEMMVTKLQRKRVRLIKIAHLQDEIGDRIKFKHPYSQADIALIITDIKRRFKKPSSLESNDGYFMDDIEGWVIS
jgi:hypothetical protein